MDTGLERRRMLLTLAITALLGTPTCCWAADWGSWSAQECYLPGRRRYESRLWNIAGSWEQACRTTPVPFNGVTYPQPHRCENRGFWSGMIGHIYAPDSGCTPTWGSFKDDGCVQDGYRRWSSVLWGIPQSQSWEEWCANTGATVQGVTFNVPTTCVNTVLNIWGQFLVPDPCCLQSTTQRQALEGTAAHHLSTSHPALAAAKGAQGRKVLEDVLPLLHSRAQPKQAPGRKALERRREDLMLGTCLAPGGGGPPQPPGGGGLGKGVPCSAVGASHLLILQLLVWLLNNRNWEVLWSTGGRFQGGVRPFVVQPDQTTQSRMQFVDGASQPTWAAPSGSWVRVNTLVVPQTMASANSLVPHDNGWNNVPPTTYTIPRGTPGQANGYFSVPMPSGTRPDVSLILTPLFSGCSFAVAVAPDPSSGVLTAYFAHIQPSSNPDDVAMSDRASLALLIADRAGFDQVTIQNRMHFFSFGGRDFGPHEVGYGDYGAQLIGLLTERTIFLQVSLQVNQGASLSWTVDLGELGRSTQPPISGPPAHDELLEVGT